MTEVDQALALILAETKNFGTEEVSLLAATGRVLAEDIKAGRNYPPFDRVTMDGIAINTKAFADGNRQFQIETIQAAGQPQVTLTQLLKCIEVMTGAMLPVGTDAVIPYELCNIDNGIAVVEVAEVKSWQNIHKTCTDSKQGDILVARSTKITAPVTGLLAAEGYAVVKVYALPRLAVCATGDELVEVDQMPMPHQIRQSNSYMLLSALQAEGIAANRYHLADDTALLKQELTRITGQYDAVLLSGAVSKGRFDHLPQVLKELGCQVILHGIAQRPGKPFYFGKMPNGSLIFGFPGNPVSTYVCYQLYFKSWLGAGLGQAVAPLSAFLSKPYHFKPDLSLHLLVTISAQNGRLIAHPVETSTSGDMVSLAVAQGLLTLPRGREDFGTDEAFSLHLL